RRPDLRAGIGSRVATRCGVVGDVRRDPHLRDGDAAVPLDGYLVIARPACRAARHPEGNVATDDLARAGPASTEAADVFALVAGPRTHREGRADHETEDNCDTHSH